LPNLINFVARRYTIKYNFRDQKVDYFFQHRYRVRRDATYYLYAYDGPLPAIQYALYIHNIIYIVNMRGAIVIAETIRGSRSGQ